MIAGIFGYLYLTQKSSASISIPLKNLGIAQTIENRQGQTTIKIAHAGYYDVTTVSGNPKNAETVNNDIPTDGQTNVGIYYPAGQGIQLFKDGVVKFTPAKFVRLSNPPQLKEYGSYLVGKQFPAGDYQISFRGELPMVSIKADSVGATTKVPFGVFLEIYQPELQSVAANNGEHGTGDSPTTEGDSKSYELTIEKPTVKVSMKNGELIRVKKADNVQVILKKQ